MSPLERLITGFSEKNVLVIGDIMLDRFIWGNVSRISPEAPVPVVNVEKEAVYPGGAANVARNLVPFAGEVYIVGRVGEDRDGQVLEGILQEGGIRASGVVRTADCDTITKTRIIARKQQVVRFDRERIMPITSEQVQQVTDYVAEHAGILDGLIFSDYGKGFITQELADAVVPVARAAELVVTLDPNPNNPLKWHGLTSVKPNRAEAFREAGIPEDVWSSQKDPLQDEVLLRVGQALLERWDTEMLQMTLGEQGMILFKRGQSPFHIPSVVREVFDVSGAGDTAIALFTLSLAAGASPVEAAEISNYDSGVVVGKLGTATLTPHELIEAMKKLKLSSNTFAARV
jgi:D-beta-D-heptose 7-phosphate kinase/D-beta-D-heptose 1-phosphate adenosyltransferase